jgi:hypothetical protein
MKWLEEPFSIDPQEMAQNFAHSSWVDRSKIFAIFVAMGLAIFLLPVLICLQADGRFGDSTTWIEVLTPLWIVDVLMIWYHFRVIYMGPIPRPEGVSLEEWIDPLPMSKRYFSLTRFLLFCAIEVLAALKLDGVLVWKWFVIFVPLYVHEVTTLLKKLPMARMKIVTVEDLEKALGKPFEDFTLPEKELIAKRYSVVPAIESAEFETAHKLKGRARQDCIKIFFRAIFMVFLIIQLDSNIQWNWWLVFLPFWTMSFCICLGSYQKFREVQGQVMERDPQLFQGGVDGAGGAGADGDGESQSNYGAVGAGEDATSAATDTNMTDEEKEELKTAVVHAGSKMVGSLMSQCFGLTIVILFVAKLQGAPFPSLWILSPLLLVASVVLCCLGCTIFCITDVIPEGEEMPTAVDLEGGIGGERYKAPGVSETTPPPVTTNDSKARGTSATRRSSQEAPGLSSPSPTQSYDLD